MSPPQNKELHIKMLSKATVDNQFFARPKILDYPSNSIRELWQSYGVQIIYKTHSCQVIRKPNLSLALIRSFSANIDVVLTDTNLNNSDIKSLIFDAADEQPFNTIFSFMFWASKNGTVSAFNAVNTQTPIATHARLHFVAQGLGTKNISETCRSIVGNSINNVTRLSNNGTWTVPTDEIEGMFGIAAEACPSMRNLFATTVASGGWNRKVSNTADVFRWSLTHLEAARVFFSHV